MILDHRMDDQISEQNQEDLGLIQMIDSLQFLRIQDVKRSPYNGKVYDLKIKNHKNYQTEFGLVHNGGKRKGAMAIYLEPWHPDIFEFLELRDNTGDPEKRAYNLNLANWIPDIFMKRVKQSIEEDRDVLWSLFDPSVAPELPDLFGEPFEKRYLELEDQKKFVRQVSIRELYSRMLRTLSETGNGWMCFKDSANLKCNNAIPGITKVSSSNLCVAGDTMVKARVCGAGVEIIEKEMTIKELIGAFQMDLPCEVWSLDTNVGAFRYAKVTAGAMTNEAAGVVEVVLSSGMVLECTEDHQFLIRTHGERYHDNPGFQWMPAKDLIPGAVDRRHQTDLVCEDHFTNCEEVNWTKKIIPVYDITVEGTHNFVANGIVVHNCTEILQPSSSGQYIWRKALEMDLTGQTKLEKYSKNRVVHYDAEKDAFMILDGAECAVCNLASIAIHRYIKDGKLDKVKLKKNVALGVRNLDKVIDRNFYPINEAGASNFRWRHIGLGLMGLQDFFFKLRIPFESQEAIDLSAEIQEEIYYQALVTSCELAQELGPHEDFKLTHAAKGILQFDLWGVTPKDTKRWDELKEQIKKHGLRNSLMISIAPTVTIAAISGSSECIEPQVSNLFKRETLSGEFVAINVHLVNDLKKLGLWNDKMLNQIKTNDGSIQGITEIPEELRNLYKTAWEIKQKAIIDHAVARGAFIDQSQSLNLFMESPTIDKLSAMYYYLWNLGGKTSYYLRSKAATKINKATLNQGETRPEIDLSTVDLCESCT